MGDVDFSGLKDPRSRPRHEHVGLLRLLVAAVASGARTLRAVETFGDDLGASARGNVGLDAAPSDSTLYWMLAMQKLFGFAQVLVRQVKDALLHKRIANDLFHEGVVSIDGKSAWTGMFAADSHCQDQSPETGLPRFVLMAQRACLVSSSARPAVAQTFIGAHAGEADTFAKTFAFLMRHFRRSFEVVTYDAGGTSRANAQLVDDAHKAYVFAVKGNQARLLGAAQSRLGSKEDERGFVGEAYTEERENGATVRREIARCRVESDDPDIDFPGARALWRRRKTITRMLPSDREETTVEDFYFVTNRMFPAADALKLVRLHWGIEDGPNWAMDMVLGEDDGTPCRTGNGVAVMSWIRLLAYNLLSMWRHKLPPVRDEKAPTWARALACLRRAYCELGAAIPTLD